MPAPGRRPSPHPASRPCPASTSRPVGRYVAVLAAVLWWGACAAGPGDGPAGDGRAGEGPAVEDPPLPRAAGEEVARGVGRGLIIPWPPAPEQVLGRTVPPRP